MLLNYAYNDVEVLLTKKRLLMFKFRGEKRWRNNLGVESLVNRNLHQVDLTG